MPLMPTFPRLFQHKSSSSRAVQPCPRQQQHDLRQEKPRGCPRLRSSPSTAAGNRAYLDECPQGCTTSTSDTIVAYVQQR